MIFKKEKKAFWQARNGNCLNQQQQQQQRTRILSRYFSKHYPPWWNVGSCASLIRSHSVILTNCGMDIPPSDLLFEGRVDWQSQLLPLWIHHQCHAGLHILPAAPGQCLMTFVIHYRLIVGVWGSSYAGLGLEDFLPVWPKLCQGSESPPVSGLQSLLPILPSFPPSPSPKALPPYLCFAPFVLHGGSFQHSSWARSWVKYLTVCPSKCPCLGKPDLTRYHCV